VSTSYKKGAPGPSSDHMLAQDTGEGKHHMLERGTASVTGERKKRAPRAAE